MCNLNVIQVAEDIFVLLLNISYYTVRTCDIKVYYNQVYYTNTHFKHEHDFYFLILLKNKPKWYNFLYLANVL